MLSRTGTSKVIFGYNGRDGVVTDDNGLIYMRARYYSPEMKRFINADIIPGKLSNAVTLNRFAYANGNPVSFIDPFGLSAWSWLKDKYNKVKKKVVDTYNDVKEKVVDTYQDVKEDVQNAAAWIDNNIVKPAGEAIAINEIAKDMTVIVITHNPSSARRTNKVVLMESGRITDVYAHERFLSEY